MARIRYIKPDFFTDEELSEMPYETRLAFAGLWCHADKSGRLEDRPKYLKAMIFPYDKIDMEAQLKRLSLPKKNGYSFIIRYSLNGKSLIQITNWDKHQRPHNTEKESEFPPPEEIIPSQPLTTTEKGMGMEKLTDESVTTNNVQIYVKDTLNGNWFELFWNSYPRKIGKEAARKKWEILKKERKLPPIENVLSKLDLQKKSEQWTKDAGQFIPHPATWLNQGRWEDEIPTESESWIQKTRSIE